MTATAGTWQTFTFDGMQYELLLPNDYNPSQQYPLLLFLHGGNQESEIPALIDPWFNTPAFRSAYPAIVIAPILPNASATVTWGGYPTDGPANSAGENQALAIVEQVIATYPVNQNQVYVTGLSLGGVGTWDMMLKYNAYDGPDGRIFAAGLSLTGGEWADGTNSVPTPAQVSELQNVPIWAITPAALSDAWDVAMASDMPNGAYHFTFDGSVSGEDVWDTYYPLPTGAPIYNWMFSQAADDLVTGDDQTIITNLYQQILGRTPTASELSAGEQQLSNGEPESTLATALAQLAEVIAAPPTVTVTLGQATAITGVSISDGGSSGDETFQVVLSDNNGDLSASGSGVSGAGTTSLDITGTLTQINSDLATLSDTDGTAPSDTITIQVADSLGNVATSQTIAVAVRAPWPTDPLRITLESGGTWSVPDANDDSTYTGTVNIGLDGHDDVLQVAGATVARDQTAFVFSAGATADLRIDGIAAPIIQGSFDLPYAEASATTVNSGGDEYVLSGGISIGTEMNGGTRTMQFAAASGITVDDGGTEYIYSGGEAISTTVSSGGDEDVSSGGDAVSTTVSNGGYEFVLSSGTAIDATASNGGDEDVFAGGKAISATVSSGGYEFVLHGGTASFTTASSGGDEDVFSGGESVSTTISSGGYAFVLPGGTASFTTASSGGAEDVFSGGEAVSTTVSNGGAAFVLSSGTAINATVSSGGDEDVFSGGTTSFTTVSSGGFAFVLSSGRALDTTVSSGGHEVLSSGGSATSTTVNGDGFEVISSGGSAISTTVSLGGVIDVAYLSYTSGGSASLTQGDMLTVSVGGNSYTQQLAGDYDGETFQLYHDPGSGTLLIAEEQGAPTASPPSISGAVANQGDPDQAPIEPFAGVTVSDPTGDGSDATTVTLSAAGNGTLSNIAAGTCTGATGIYSLTASPGAISTALDSLVFTPVVPASGVYVTTTGFTVGDRGLAGSASDSTTSVTAVQQVLGLTSILLSNIALSVSPDGSGFAPPNPSKTNEAVVTTPTTSTTYMLPVGYQAEYLGGNANATLQDTSVGNAVLVGNSGNDLLIGAAANDSIVAGDGNNALEAGSGTVALLTGNGNDSVTTSTNSTYTVTLGGGTDTVFAAGTGTIVGGTGADLIDATGTGVSGSDTILSQGLEGSVLGGAGSLTVLDAGAHDWVQAGSGAITVTLDGSLGRIRGGTGSLSALAQTSGNTVIGGTAGLASVTVAAATASTDVFGRSGNLTILDLGADALIGSGEGNAVATLDGAGSQIYGGTGTLNVVIDAASVIAAGLAANTTVDASSSLASGALVFGGFSNTPADDGTLSVRGGANQLLVVTGGSSSTIDAATSDTVFTGIYIGTGSIAGNVLINGNASALQVNFIGGAGSATVLGGEGVTTIFGNDGADVNFVGSVTGGILFANGTSAGSETLSAGSSTTNDSLFGSRGNVSLIAGSGADFLDAGANTGSLGGAGTVTGGDTIVGGTGADLMLFSHGAFAGGAVVTNFRAADTISLSGYNAVAEGNQATMALANATTAGSDTTIALADGTTITFVDTTTAQLQGHVFSS